MKILIIDRDELNSQMISSKLETQGHKVNVQAIKNDAISSMGRENFDIVIIDPSPSTNPRSLVQEIRRTLGNYVYIILAYGAGAESTYQLGGANARILKPYDFEMLESIIKSAGRLIHKVSQLGDDSIDFPSAGGVIAKSAFNQLFLSAIERADRYAEKNYAVFIEIANYLDMTEKDGPYYADLAVAKMSKHLTQIRRQSDIIGQIARQEYALLLQRPQYESEPVDAANRFAEELSKLKSIKETVESDPEISVRLVELPSGTKIVDHLITLQA